jgi:hypothetical protein
MREAMASANLPAMGATLTQLNERVGAAGQVTAYNGAREVLRTRVRMLRETPLRGQDGQQVIRMGIFTGRTLSQDPREVGDEIQKWNDAAAERLLLPGSPADSVGHNCSFRLIVAFSTLDAFNRGLESFRPVVFEQNALNFELKVLVRARPEASVSPTLITERAVLLTYDD